MVLHIRKNRRLHYRCRYAISIISQIEQYFEEFLKDTYPGAKSSPTAMVRMMGTPDIQPDTAIAGE